jgi:hypothetical protein
VLASGVRERVTRVGDMMRVTRERDDEGDKRGRHDEGRKINLLRREHLADCPAPEKY